MRHLNRAGMSAGRVAGERALYEARRKANVKMSRQTSTQGNQISHGDTDKNDVSSSFFSKYQSSFNSNVLQEKYYTEMGEAAVSMQDRVSAFLKQGENTLFGKVTVDEKTGESVVSEEDKKKIIEQVESFLDDYNTMRRRMEHIGGQVRQIYIQQMDKQADKYEKELAEIGITKAEDGTLYADTSVLKEADAAKIKSLFGTVGSFADKVSSISNAVEKNARDNLYDLKFSSYSSNYSSNGNYYDSYSNTGKNYNIWG